MTSQETATLRRTDDGEMVDVLPHRDEDFTLAARVILAHVPHPHRPPTSHPTGGRPMRHDYNPDPAKFTETHTEETTT